MWNTPLMYVRRGISVLQVLRLVVLRRQHDMHERTPSQVRHQPEPVLDRYTNVCVCVCARAHA